LLAPGWLWYLGASSILTTGCVFGFFLLGIARSLFFAAVGKETFKRKVLVLGAGFRARQIHEDLETPFNRKGFILTGFVPLPDEPVEIGEDYLLNLPTTVHQYIIKHPVHEIVVAVDDRRKGLPMEDLLECKMEGVRIVDGATFYERESRKVALEMVTRGWLVFSDGFTVSSVFGFGKRSLDILAAGALLLAGLPLMILTAIAIKVEDGFEAPVFYSQERVGLNGNVFRVHKFRSMRIDAEKDGAVWASQNDARVTKVGEFIRKVRIDELPQIFNVLSGSMAFVGPRPERPVFVEQLSEKIPFYSERHRVKPGLTGWAQLCFAYADNEEDTREKLRYDLYYIKNQSLLLDLLIIIQTVEVVLFKKGSR
jgi:sugar transferase (PEP-CTERM system associated)